MLDSFLSKCLAAAGLGMASLAADLASADIDFASEIQPLLARKCYACHGPDLQEGSLRFDDRESWLSEADSGLTPIVPGQAGDSELIRRISAEDEDERMPPEGKPLSESEIALLTEWIASGAEYTRHWAFQPIRRPPLPEVDNRNWPRGAVDHFVLSKLGQSGLRPVARAKPASLIRRVYLDITGLPPAPETVAELSAAWSEETYVRLIDRLLADPAFGERWGAKLAGRSPIRRNQQL